MPGLLTLPPELIVQICNLLGTADIISLSRSHTSLALAAHNTELWREKFSRQPSANILDKLCTVWADLKIQLEVDMQQLVIENVLAALTRATTLDACKIYIRSACGDHVLNHSGLSDLEHFEELLQIRSCASVFKIVDCADGKLEAHELANIARRVEGSLEACRLHEVSLSTATSVTDLVSILEPAQTWNIDRLHITDHEICALVPALLEVGTIRNLYVYQTGGYLQDVTVMKSLHNLFRVSYFVTLVCGGAPGESFDSSQKSNGNRLGGKWKKIVSSAVRNMRLPKSYSEMLIVETQK